jgi:hypothetical protein
VAELVRIGGGDVGKEGEEEKEREKERERETFHFRGEHRKSLLYQLTSKIDVKKHHIPFCDGEANEGEREGGREGEGE